MPLRRKFWWTPLLSHNQSSQPRFILFNLIFIYNLHSKISCIWCIICRVQIQWIVAAFQIRQNRVSIKRRLISWNIFKPRFKFKSRLKFFKFGHRSVNTFNFGSNPGASFTTSSALKQYIYRFKFLSNSCTSVYDSLPWYS